MLRKIKFLVELTVETIRRMEFLFLATLSKQINRFTRVHVMKLRDKKQRNKNNTLSGQGIRISRTEK